MINKKNIITLVVIIGLLFLGYTYFSDGVGAPSGAAHWQHESFLQGLSGGARDEFSVSNTGQVNLVEAVVDVNAVGNNTLTASQSGTTFMIATGTTSTLPAVKDGLVYRFVATAAFDTTNFIIDSAEGDNIEGTLLVAGAVVDCDAEDQINFVADGENLGDYVELRSDGTSWLIGSSGALTSAKLTCTDP